MNQDKFFITEDAYSSKIPNWANSESAIDSKILDISKNEFLDLIQSLEDANIFLLDNVQMEEEELEKF